MTTFLNNFTVLAIHNALLVIVITVHSFLLASYESPEMPDLTISRYALPENPAFVLTSLSAKSRCTYVLSALVEPGLFACNCVECVLFGAHVVSTENFLWTRFFGFGKKTPLDARGDDVRSDPSFIFSFRALW